MFTSFLRLNRSSFSFSGSHQPRDTRKFWKRVTGSLALHLVISSAVRYLAVMTAVCVRVPPTPMEESRSHCSDDARIMSRVVAQTTFQMHVHTCFALQYVRHAKGTVGLSGDCSQTVISFYAVGFTKYSGTTCVLLLVVPQQMHTSWNWHHLDESSEVEWWPVRYDIACITTSCLQYSWHWWCKPGFGCSVVCFRQKVIPVTVSVLCGAAMTKVKVSAQGLCSMIDTC